MEASWSFRETFGNFWKLSETSGNFWKLSETSGNFRKLYIRKLTVTVTENGNILALRKISSKMRDGANRDFWPKEPVAEWAQWLILHYYRYPQRLFTTIFLRLRPSHWENAKFLRDLNNIVMPKFYTESTDKHLESDFGPFWNYQKSPVTKSFPSFIFLQVKFHFLSFEVETKQKIRILFFHISWLSTLKKINVDSHFYESLM